jgi:hypothetical protein
MKSIKAYQLLYSRIEAAAFSHLPNANIKRSGYQVVYHAPAIAGDVPGIEKRVQCFQSRDDNLTRYQFFRTDSGMIAVTHSTRIETDKVINDQNGRPGIFIAHCLVIEPQDFRDTVKNDPFLIFNATVDGEYPFIYDAQNLLAVTENNQPGVTLEIRDQEKPLPENWDQEELYNLIELGEKGLTDQSLALIGDIDSIEHALQLTFHLSYPDSRAGMSFDTFVDGCNPTPGTYWAVGSTRRISNSRFINVDLAAPKIPAQTGETAPKSLGYGNWLKHSLSGKRASLRDINSKAPLIQDIAAAFESGNALNGELDTIAVQEFLAVNHKLILDRFKTVLATHMSQPAAEKLIQDIQSQKEKQQSTFTDEIIISVASQKRFTDPKLLANEVYQWIVRTHYPNLAVEAEALIELGNSALDNRLVLVGNLCAPISFSDRFKGILKGVLGRGNNAKEAERHKALKDLLQSRQLETVIAELSGFDWADPSYFVSAETASAVVNYYVRHPLEDEKRLVVLIRVLIQIGEGKLLGNFNSQIKGMEKGYVQDIAKVITKHPDSIDADFKATVEASIVS